MKIKSFQDFLTWQKASENIIKVNTFYIDMAGDLHAGLLLSQIVYWHIPSKNGNPKMRIHKKDENGEEKTWIAKKRSDWWDEVRLTVKQVVRAINKLKDRDLIEVAVHRFKSVPVHHIRINEDIFLRRLNKAISYPQANPYFPKDTKGTNRENEPNSTPKDTKGTNQKDTKGTFHESDKRAQSLTEITREKDQRMSANFSLSFPDFSSSIPRGEEKSKERKRRLKIPTCQKCGKEIGEERNKLEERCQNCGEPIDDVIRFKKELEKEKKEKEGKEKRELFRIFQD